MYKTRNTETGNGMRGTQGMGGMLYSGECRQIFRGMSSDISGNVAKHFRGYVLKHSGEFCQTFRGILPVFVVKEDNYWAESHKESCQTSALLRK